MRRGFGIGAAILVILLLVGVGIGAYNVGLDEGIQQAGTASRWFGTSATTGFGFFPFFLFFPLFFLALFAFKGAMWRRHWDHDGGPGGHHGPGVTAVGSRDTRSGTAGSTRTVGAAAQEGSPPAPSLPPAAGRWRPRLPPPRRRFTVPSEEVP